MYQVDKQIEVQDQENIAICSHCNHAHPFKKLPLFFLTGASGAGKSTIGLKLQQAFSDVVILENDCLPWDKIDGKEFQEMLLRISKNIHQNGKSVLHVGCNIPAHFEDSLEKRYFADFHYLALVCDKEVLKERLLARPAWRKFNLGHYWTSQSEFNEWFKTHHTKVQPNIDLIDTTNLSVELTLEKVIRWLQDKMKNRTSLSK